MWNKLTFQRIKTVWNETKTYREIDSADFDNFDDFLIAIEERLVNLGELEVKDTAYPQYYYDTKELKS